MAAPVAKFVGKVVKYALVARAGYKIHEYVAVPKEIEETKEIHPTKSVDSPNWKIILILLILFLVLILIAMLIFAMYYKWKSSVSKKAVKKFKQDLESSASKVC